jgi:hypothetical protein
MNSGKPLSTVAASWSSGASNSAASAWVRQEYEAGIVAEKEMIPILLDDAEMPPPLRAYQRLDFAVTNPTVA